MINMAHCSVFICDFVVVNVDFLQKFICLILYNLLISMKYSLVSLLENQKIPIYLKIFVNDILVLLFMFY